MNRTMLDLWAGFFVVAGIVVLAGFSLMVSNASLALGRNGVGDTLDEGNEALGLGDEVGFTFDLGDRCGGAASADGDGALAVLPVGTLGRLCQTLLAQRLEGGLHIALRGLEGALGLHHADTGELTKRLDVFRTDC